MGKHITNTIFFVLAYVIIIFMFAFTLRYSWNTLISEQFGIFRITFEQAIAVRVVCLLFYVTRENKRKFREALMYAFLSGTITCGFVALTTATVAIFI